MSTFPRNHIGLGVSNLESAVDFYSALLGGPPTKVRERYARFEPTGPSINLALVEQAQPSAVHGHHYGIQVTSVEAVADATKRLQAAGLPTRSEEEASCCYAVQTKTWVTDPDGNEWEIFVTLDDDSKELSPDGECCIPAESGQSTCC